MDAAWRTIGHTAYECQVNMIPRENTTASGCGERTICSKSFSRALHHNAIDKNKCTRHGPMQIQTLPTNWLSVAKRQSLALYRRDMNTKRGPKRNSNLADNESCIQVLIMETVCDSSALACAILGPRLDFIPRHDHGLHDRHRLRGHDLDRMVFAHDHLTRWLQSVDKKSLYCGILDYNYITSYYIYIILYIYSYYIYHIFILGYIESLGATTC